MKKRYFKRFQKLTNRIYSNTLQVHAKLGDCNSFTRRRKMPLEDLVLATLSKKGLTTSMELRHYFIQRGRKTLKISTQGYLQQRKKLNPDIFTLLNQEYLQDFYFGTEPVLWHGFLVFAIDGSKAEVPNSEENRQAFGLSCNQHSDGQVRALISGMFDIFNHFLVDLQIASVFTSERTLAKENLIATKKLLHKYPMLVIFDRGYPSLEFIHFLEKENIQYLFRSASNDYVKERSLMKTSDESVELLHTNGRMKNIKRSHPEIWEEINMKKSTKSRIILSKLTSGKEIALLTSLSREHTSQSIQDIYFRRWDIEKTYHTLKNKMKFESVTGKSSIYIYQDFWAQMLIYNMIQDIRHAANMEVEEKTSYKTYQYPMKVNENIAIGLFKETFISIFMETNIEIQKKKLRRLQKNMEAYVLPVRRLASQERRHNPSNKYKNNQKNSF